MPDRDYKINYSAPTGKIERDIDRVIAKLKDLDVMIEKTKKSLRTLGSDTPGIPKMVGLLKSLDRELMSKVSDATKAERALSGVGKGNRSVAELTNRLKELEKQLAAVTSAATSATNAGAGVGGGGGGGAGGKGGGGAGGLIGGIGRASVAYAGYRALRGVGRTAAESTGDRREFFRDASKVATDYAKDLHQLAVLQGKTVADNETIRGDLEFQAKTNLGPDKSGSFRLEYGGAISAAMDQRAKDGQPTIAPKVAEQLEVAAGKLAARYDLDPVTGGRMAGLLGVTEKVPTAEGGAQDMAAVLEILNAKGVGRVSDLATSLVGLSGQMLEEGGGGRFTDYREMAARLAAGSVAESGSASKAARRIEQSSKLLRKFDEPGVGAHEGHGPAEFLAGAGVTAEDSYEQAIRKVMPKLQDANGGFGQAGTKLKSYGFNNSTEIKALLEEMKVTPLAEAALKSPEIQARAARNSQLFETYRNSTPGQRQAAEIQDFRSTVEVGLAGRALDTARLKARSAMASEDTLKAGVVGSMADKAISLFGSAGGISGEDLRVDTRAIQDLQSEGEKYGVDVLGKYPGLDIGPRMANFNDEKALAGQFSAASEAVEGARKAAMKARELAAALDAMKPKAGGGPAGQGGVGFGAGRP